MGVPLPIITCLVPAASVSKPDPRPPFGRTKKNSNARKETSSVLMIRLSRVGARKQPHYRVVVIEKERARNGRPVEIVGTYNPRTTPASVELKRERIDYWRSKGAQVSERVGKILGFAASAPAATV
jgi:small subunit ribosomal protein S16